MNYQGFTMAWLDLISYNNFINYFLDDSLNKDNKEKYEKYLALLTELLSYLNFIKNQSINIIFYNLYRLKTCYYCQHYSYVLRHKRPNIRKIILLLKVTNSSALC
jgi:hypothetical protein